jgi:hypothetical protein
MSMLGIIIAMRSSVFNAAVDQRFQQDGAALQ